MISKKVNLKLFIYNIEQIFIYIYLTIFICCNIFYLETFNIRVEYQINMFCALVLLPLVKNSIYRIADNNSIVSSDNSDPNTELLQFSIPTLFNMCNIKIKAATY